MKYEDFIRQRITELRLQKGVSEYKMSLDLGHSKGYIQSITSNRALPSMSEFLSICEYFGITPFEFFSTNENNLLLSNELKDSTNNLDKDDMSLLLQIANRLGKK